MMGITLHWGQRNDIRKLKPKWRGGRKGTWQLGSRGAAVLRWAQRAAFVWGGMSQGTALAAWHCWGPAGAPSEPPGSERWYNNHIHPVPPVHPSSSQHQSPLLSPHKSLFSWRFPWLVDPTQTWLFSSVMRHL